MNRVFKEIRALKAHKETQDHKANKEFKAMSDRKEFKVKLDLKEFKAKLEFKGFKVSKEFKVMSDRKEFKEYRVSKEFKVMSGRKESKAILGMMETTDFYRMAQPLETPLFGMAPNGSLIIITFLIQEVTLVLELLHLLQNLRFPVVTLQLAHRSNIK